MPTELYRTRFVYSDMPGLRCDNSLVLMEERIDNRCIGLSTADQKMHRRIRAVARVSDTGTRSLTIFIGSVSSRLFHICLYEALDNRGMRPFHIIRSEKDFVLSFHNMRLSDNGFLCKIFRLRVRGVFMMS